MVAMAAIAANACVTSPSSSSLSSRPSSLERESRRSSTSSGRVQIVPLVHPRATRATVASSAAVPSSSASSSLNTISGSGGPRREWRCQAVAEQLQAAATEETSDEGGFPSETLSVFFEAQGSLPEASVAKLTTSLEGVEGVSNVDISATSDGTATVKLTKQMSVQETGVASGLVDVLLKGGFKLQALNLGFDEEDGDDDEMYDYDIASSTEELEATE